MGGSNVVHGHWPTHPLETSTVIHFMIKDTEVHPLLCKMEYPRKVLSRKSSGYVFSCFKLRDCTSCFELLDMCEFYELLSVALRYS